MLPLEVERQIAWANIRDLILRRTDPTAIAGAIRERLNAKYDADEIRQSWLTLTEADPLALIKIFCHLPYLANGKTDSIARTVMETYVTRLTHQKYAATYHKVVNSLKTMFHARPDSPTLVNFIALVKWVDSTVQSLPNAKRVSLEFGSQEYFDFAAKYPQTTPWLALGRKVQFVLDNTIYEVHE